MATQPTAQPTRARPVHEVRLGAIRASIWANETENGTRHNVTFDRTYRDGLGRAELGAELGIGEHGVRNLLQRLRATLRDCIERRRRS